MNQCLSSVWRGTLLLALLLGAAASSRAAPSRETVWWGTVTYVVDGDTLRIKPSAGGKPVSLRLDGIDAPEICQAGGEASRDALKRQVLGQRVAVEGRRHDNYGRLLAPVEFEGKDVGEWMVEKGQAWSYRYRNDGGPYVMQERRARAAGLGLFSRGNLSRPMEPRLFRKQHGSCFALPS